MSRTSKVYLSEVVTLALLFALKRVNNRAFYRWLRRDYLDMYEAPLTATDFRFLILGDQ